jgi:hypothetical protein
MGIARVAGVVNKNARGIQRWYRYVTSSLMDGFFEGRRDDRDYMIDRFNRWNEEVQATVPADRLLVLEVVQGWEPLCDFLGVAVPDEPFPRSNAADSFQNRMKLRNIAKSFTPNRKD